MELAHFRPNKRHFCSPNPTTCGELAPQAQVLGPFCGLNPLRMELAHFRSQKCTRTFCPPLPLFLQGVWCQRPIFGALLWLTPPQNVPRKPRVSAMNARPTHPCIGHGYLRMIKSLLSESLKDQATSFLGPLYIDSQEIESNQARFTVQCSLLTESLRALQCRVCMG